MRKSDVIRGNTGDKVSEVINSSYRKLSTEEARVFRLLGLHPGPDFGADATAALTGLDRFTAHQHLETLAGLNLIKTTGPERYQIEDQSRAYANDRSQAEDTAEGRHQAITRLLTWYARTAQKADLLMYPGLPVIGISVDPVDSELSLADRGQAVAWLKAEHRAFVASLWAAADYGANDLAMALAGSARMLRALPQDQWLVRFKAESLGIEIAKVAGNQTAMGFLQAVRGDTLCDLGRYDEAETEFSSVVELANQTGDQRGEWLGLLGLGQVQLEREHYLQAREYYQRALPVTQELGDARAEAVAEANLCQICIRLGQYDQALLHAERELVLRRQAKDQIGEGYALFNAASAKQGVGEHDIAIELTGQALGLYRSLEGTQRSQALVLQAAAISWEHTGNLNRASECLRQAAELLADVDDPNTNKTRQRLSILESQIAGDSRS